MTFCKQRYPPLRQRQWLELSTVANFGPSGIIVGTKFMEISVGSSGIVGSADFCQQPVADHRACGN